MEKNFFDLNVYINEDDCDELLIVLTKKFLKENYKRVINEINKGIYFIEDFINDSIKNIESFPVYSQVLLHMIEDLQIRTKQECICIGDYFILQTKK